MSEELLQRDLLKNPPKIGKWDFYNVGATSIKQLKEAQIIRNVDYGKEEKKKVDALLVQKKNVIAVIEYKKPSEFNTKAKQEKAILQELEVAKKLDAHIIIATDTKESIWINVLTGNTIKNEDGKELKFNFDSSDEKLPELIEKIIASINEKNDQIKPKSLVNPTDLAKQIWQDIWISSGESPTNSLYTFVELFIFKYLSDLKILGQGLDFNHLMERYDYNLENPEEQALDYYANNIRPYIKKLFPEGIDKTTIINGSVFVNKEGLPDKRYSGVFKKVLIKFKNYGRLENIDYDFKSKLFEVFLKESISKKNLGQFFTPIKVVRAIGEMAKDEIKPNIKICDPASGVGKFLLEPIRTKIDQLFEVKKGEIISKIQIHGFDKGFEGEEQKTIILAKANMLIYFSDLIKDNPTITNKFSELFNKSFELKTNSILGTLSYPIENEYDLILTNPPYVTSGIGNLKEEISNNTELKDYYKVNAMGVEGLFMEWIVRALKPGGKAFIIVPDGIFNRQNDKNLRRFLLDECYIDGIISLPIKTFFTTPKKTYILCITKKEDKKTTQTDPVFTYLVSEMGESRDVYRFDIEQDDLSEAVNLYSFFKGNKKGFGTINSDKRCKIQLIEKFDPDTYWSIERWWTKEEQIELGIAEEDKVVKFDDFGEFINDISETLKEYSGLLREVAEKKKSVNEFKEVFLIDKNFFNLFIGKRLVKKDLINIKGSIPIYSANVKEPISFHSQSNIEDFNSNFVIWGIDGNFEYNFIPKNNPFVTTDHCGTIRILNDDILPEYLMIQLEKVKHKYGFDRGLRSSLKNMQAVSIEIPFDENGNIDVEKQKEIIEKFEYIQSLKLKISNYTTKIHKIIISITSNYLSNEVLIQKILDSPPTNSGLKKEHVSISMNKLENVPVYSATMNEDAIFGYVSEQSKWKKYENVLTWNKDGSAGFVFYRKNKFVPYEKVKLLKLKEKFQEVVNYEYLKYVIQSRLIEEGFGFSIKCSMDKVLKLSIPIPINSKGEFDLKAQQEIAEKYRKIEQIKKNISEELDKIANIEIDYE